MKSIGMKSRVTVTIGMAFACLVLALCLPQWRSELRAQGYYPTAVVVNGRLSMVDSPELELQLQVSARSSRRLNTPLAGQGSIRAVGPESRDAEVRLSRFSLTGSVTGSWVTMGGAVTFSTDPALIGIPVLITADEQTGEIMLYFGEIVLEGSGTVLVR